MNERSSIPPSPGIAPPFGGLISFLQMSTTRSDTYASRLFWCSLALTTAAKVVGAMLFPLTGDEAYFLVWGRNPALGYYDHGPMTGWWLAALLQASDAVGWVRLPALLIPIGVAWWLRETLRPSGQTKADLAATIFLLSPINVVTFLHTTDTSLLAFTMLAGALALAAGRRKSSVLWLLAGFFLGLAFLAKYFAVLIGLAWAVWQLTERPRSRWRPVLLVLIGATPAVAMNVLWNHAHGWTNVLFNVMTRNSTAGINFITPLLYPLFWAFVLGPALMMLVVRGVRRHGWRESWNRLQQGVDRGVLFMAVVPVAVFGAVALVQDVGLHWLLAFAPWVILAVLAAAPEKELARTIRPAVAYAGVLVGLLMLACLAPTDWLRNNKNHASVIVARYADEVVAALEPYRSEYLLVSPSYARAALLAYHFGVEVPVFGPGSFHGRQDDLLTDFRALNGRNLMLLSERDRKGMVHPWFDKLEVREVTVKGVRFELLLGRGFRYAVYREQVLQHVADRYYVMPSWLATMSLPSDFVRRYGFSQGNRENGISSLVPQDSYIAD